MSAQFTVVAVSIAKTMQMVPVKDQYRYWLRIVYFSVFMYALFLVSLLFI